MLMQQPMWAMSVVMLDVLLQYQLQVTGSGDQQTVEALPALSLLCRSRIKNGQ